LSIQEALYFSDRLAVANMSRGGFVVNRVRRIPSPADETPSREPLRQLSRDQVRQTLGAHGLSDDRDLAKRIVEAYVDGLRMAALDRAHIGLLERHVGADIPVVLVPEIAGDVTSLRELWEVAESLACSDYKSPLRLSSSGSIDDADRRAVEAELLAQPVDDETLIRKMNGVRSIRHRNEGRRRHRSLRHVEDAR
jgi:hypothetical protein